MTDLTTQASAARLLSDAGWFTVDARSCDSGNFLIVECADATHGPEVYTSVMMIDPDAELIHSTRQRDEWDELSKGTAPLSS